MISVAMTTYNGEKYVEQQIESIFNQTILPDELIILDDCSTDNTLEIVRRKAIECDKKINIIIEKNDVNVGYVRNFYKAISLTKGDIIFLADQDDVWHENKIEKMIKVLKEKKCEAICSNFSMIDGNGNAIPDKSKYNVRTVAVNKTKHMIPVTFGRLVFGNVAQGCTFCFTQEVKKIYLQISNFEVIHDYQILMIASLVGAVFFVNEELIDYRIHTGNAIGFSEKKVPNAIKIKKPSKNPMMVCFLNDIDKVYKVKFKWFWNLLYYLRIPYLGFKFMQKVRR